VKKFGEKGGDIRHALVENENVKESLEVALIILENQEHEIKNLKEKLAQVYTIPGLKLSREVKVELFIMNKISLRRSLIAELRWFDEAVYYNEYCSFMYQLCYENGASYTCASTNKAGPN